MRATLDVGAELPKEVLGQTVFQLDGRSEVSVNSDLTADMEELETTGSLGRWRATLAHEAGHILLHRHLYFLDSRQGQLFKTALQAPTLMRCLKREVSFTPRNYDWREVQANRAMAALLMPRGQFRELAKRRLEGMGISESLPISANSHEAAVLAGSLASELAVSRTAASLRLAALGFTASNGSSLL